MIGAWCKRPTSVLAHRPGFTLVEILVSIVITGIIASMLTVAIRGANRQANDTRAQNLIDQLNLTILQIYEQETQRQVDLPTSTLQPNAATPSPNSLADKSRALAMLNWQRDYLRCALPDRRQDLISPPIQVYYRLYRGIGATNIVVAQADPLTNATLTTAVPLWNVTEVQRSTRWAAMFRYRQRVWQLVRGVRLGNGLTAPNDFDDCVDGNDNNGEWTVENQGAECLYLILSSHVIDGIPATDELHDRDIGDTDEDGVPEILDAWGRPLGFIRWPCGYYLTPQWGATLTSTELAERKIELGKDSLDVLSVDPRYDNTAIADYQADDPFPLLPLIVSAGADNVFDIVGLDNPLSPAIDYTTGGFPIAPADTLGFPGTPYFIDPYQYSVAVPDQLGALADTADLGTDNTPDNVYPSFDVGQ